MIVSYIYLEENIDGKSNTFMLFFKWSLAPPWLRTKISILRRDSCTWVLGMTHVIIVTPSGTTDESYAAISCHEIILTTGKSY